MRDDLAYGQRGEVRAAEQLLQEKLATRLMKRLMRPQVLVTEHQFIATENATAYIRLRKCL